MPPEMAGKVTRVVVADLGHHVMDRQQRALEEQPRVLHAEDLQLAHGRHSGLAPEQMREVRWRQSDKGGEHRHRKAVVQP